MSSDFSRNRKVVSQFIVNRKKSFPVSSILEVKELRFLVLSDFMKMSDHDSQRNEAGEVAYYTTHALFLVIR